MPKNLLRALCIALEDVVVVSDALFIGSMGVNRRHTPTCRQRFSRAESPESVETMESR